LDDRCSEAKSSSSGACSEIQRSSNLACLPHGHELFHDYDGSPRCIRRCLLLFRSGHLRNYLLYFGKRVAGQCAALRRKSVPTGSALRLVLKELWRVARSAALRDKRVQMGLASVPRGIPIVGHIAAHLPILYVARMRLVRLDAREQGTTAVLVVSVRVQSELRVAVRCLVRRRCLLRAVNQGKPVS
jgi:hypothetical protein